MLVGNLPSDVLVETSSFYNMGQSGVMLVGNDSNDSTRASGAHVVSNTISGVGQLLASAGGVLLPVGHCCALQPGRRLLEQHRGGATACRTQVC